MVAHSRYNVSESNAGLFEGVLKNKTGITSQKDLGILETLLLKDAYIHFQQLLEQGKVQFNLSFLYEVHKYFLFTLYSWAGKTRTVDISKNGVLFAPVAYMDISLKHLENTLHAQIPNPTDTKKQISEKLAIIHNECNMVHPFRDGNGRTTIRLFLDLLASTLDYEFINWSIEQKNMYLTACKAGIAKNHTPMQTFIYKALSKK